MTRDRSGNTGSMHKTGKQQTPLRQVLICILTERLFPHCFGTFSISFPFHSVLHENNFNTASEKMLNAHTLQWKYKPHFELPENSVGRWHHVQYRNPHCGRERSLDLHMCHQEPQTGHIPDWKTNEPQNIPRNIWLYLFFNYHRNKNLNG